MGVVDTVAVMRGLGNGGVGTISISLWFVVAVVTGVVTVCVELVVVVVEVAVGVPRVANAPTSSPRMIHRPL